MACRPPRYEKVQGYSEENTAKKTFIQDRPSQLAGYDAVQRAPWSENNTMRTNTKRPVMLLLLGRHQEKRINSSGQAWKIRQYRPTKSSNASLPKRCFVEAANSSGRAPKQPSPQRGQSVASARGDLHGRHDRPKVAP